MSKPWKMWGDLPPKLISEKVLIQGGAFRTVFTFPPDTAKFRFFFVLNRSPQTDETLVLATATTQIDKREKVRRANPAALVYIDQAEYESIEERSLIDVESIPSCVWPRADLSARIEAHQVEPLQPLPTALLERILKAVRISRTISPKLKRLVLGEEDVT